MIALVFTSSSHYIVCCALVIIKFTDSVAPPWSSKRASPQLRVASVEMNGVGEGPTSSQQPSTTVARTPSSSQMELALDSHSLAVYR